MRPNFADRCSTDLRDALLHCRGRATLDRGDLLYGLLQLPDARSTRVLEAMKVERAVLAEGLDRPGGLATRSELTPQLLLAIDLAAAEAALEGRDRIDSAHLLLGLARGTRSGYDLHRDHLMCAARLVAGTREGKVCVWDLFAGNGPRLYHAGRPVFAVAADAEWRHAVAACGDGRLDVWDLKRDLHMRFPTGHAGPIRAVSWSPSAPRLLTGSDDGTAVVWDAENGDRVWVLAEHDGPVRAVTYDPHGAWLYTGSDDGTIKRWDGATGALDGTLEGHAAAVVRLAFLDENQPLVSRAEDDEAILWADPRQHHEVAPDPLAPVFARAALTPEKIRLHLPGA